MKKEKKSNPFFSIILSIYNVEKYLERCIESIICQDFENFELILVDDGSKDSSGVICDKWEKKDKRIKVIHKQNQGLGMARNTGLENATGKYIFFFDSDDYILPGIFKEIYNNLKINEVNVVFFGFKRVNAKNEEFFRLVPNPEKKYYTDKNEIKNKLLPYFITKNPYSGISYNLRISAWSCCLNVEFLKKNKMKFVSEREYISEDIYFFIELFNVLNTVLFLDKIYYAYCQNEGSLTFSYKENRFDRIKKFYKDARRLADELNYDGEVQLRLYGSFIATTISCLKMEVANYKKIGIRSTINNMKVICNDKFLNEAINEFPKKYIKISWKIFIYLINKKRFKIIFAFLLLQYYHKGV